MNLNNLEPVMIKECNRIEIADSKKSALLEVKKIEAMQFKCEQVEDKISYACLNEDLHLVGRVIVLKDLNECKEFPARVSKDMKNLMNIKK